MSVCAVVITGGGVVFGYDTLVTPMGQFIEPFQKCSRISTGDYILCVGAVGSGRKLISEIDRHGGDIDIIPREAWQIDHSGESTNDIIQIKNDLSCWVAGGPNEILQVKAPGYFAIGSGADYAMAVLWSLLAGKKSVSLKKAESALRTALLAACALDDSCGEPIVIKKLEA